MEAMMMSPPIVGVPSFSFWPSRPNSRTVSPICFFFSNLIIHFPPIHMMNSEKTTARPALNEMYLKTPAPGMPNCSCK